MNWQKLLSLVATNRDDNPAIDAVNACLLPRDYGSEAFRAYLHKKQNHQDRIVVARKNAPSVEIYYTNGEVGVETRSISFRITENFFSVLRNKTDIYPL